MLYFRNNCKQIKPSLIQEETSIDHVVKSHVIKLPHFVKNPEDGKLLIEV